jgi:hypothetical protein
MGRAVAISLLAVSVVVGGLLALVTAFYVPQRVGWFSFGVAATVLTIGPYAHAVGRAFRSSRAAALPALAWLLVTMYLATMRAEGDLVVTGTAEGLAFLLLGTVSAAFGIGTVRSGVLRAERRAAERRERREAVAEELAVTPNGSSQDVTGR